MLRPSNEYERKLREHDWLSKEERAREREQLEDDRLAQRQKAGKAASKKELQDLLDPKIGGLTAPSDTSGQASIHFFLCELDREQSQDLGLVFDMQGRITHLCTKGTSIGHWNFMVSRTFPGAAVQLGDVIVSVNERREIDDMQSQISEENITSFELLVRSERDEPLVGGGGSSDEPPPPTSKHVRFIEAID